MSRLVNMHIEKSYDLHHKQKGKYFLDKILDRTDNQDLIGEVKSLNLSKIKSVFDLDLDVLQRSLDHLVLNNDILRTAFIDVGGVPKQTVYKASDVLTNELIHVDYFDEQNQIPILEYIGTPFQFDRLPLLRLGVFLNGDDSFTIVLVVNHIICDYRSLILISDKLEEYYGLLMDGEGLSRTKPRFQMQEYVQLEKNLYDGDCGKEIEGFWHRQIARLDTSFPFKTIYQGGYEPIESYRENLRKELNLHFRNLKPHEVENLIGTYHRGTSWAGSAITFFMSENVNEQVTSICRDAKCTFFIFILMAWKLHLTKMFEGRNIGVSYETTYPIWPPCYKMIGWFTNTVPCTTVVSSENGLLENLQDIQREHLEIIEGYQYPIDRILSSTDVAIDAISPVFLNFFSSDIHEEEKVLSPSYTEYSTWLYNDLDVYVYQKKNCLKIIIKFKKKLFERSFIEELAKGFRQTVNQCIADYHSAKKKVIS